MLRLGRQHNFFLKIVLYLYGLENAIHFIMLSLFCNVVLLIDNERKNDTKKQKHETPNEFRFHFEPIA